MFAADTTVLVTGSPEINDHAVTDVPAGGISFAAADADIVLLEADALSDGGALCYKVRLQRQP